jgi:mannose-6-phosphate isomerase-like protein (cupin superfamily)
MFRKKSEISVKTFTNCHGGKGDLVASLVLSKGDTNVGLQLMHDDVLPPGVSIGEHRHDGDEEFYYVVEGSGTMILDGKEYPMEAGDVSIVRPGHTHGLVNSATGPMRLIVVSIACS